MRQHDILGNATDIDASCATRRIDRIVVGLSDRRGRLPIEQLLRAKMSGVRVEDATTTYERLTGKILIDDLKPSWLIFSDGFRASRGDAVREADARSVAVDDRRSSWRRRSCC